MPVRDEPEGRFEPDPPRHPRPGREREIEVVRGYEGTLADGPEPHRFSPPAQPSRSPTSDPRTRATPRPSRRLLLAGTVAAAALPWALAHPAAPRIEDTRLLGLILGMTALKASAVIVAAGAVFWRLKRHVSGARRAGYLAGVWAMALGVGLVASRTLPFGGTLVFDAGLLALLALAVGDDRLRHGRTRGHA